MSVQALVDNTAADEWPGSDRQFRFARGYAGLASALASQAVPELCEVRLGTEATSVAWRPKQVVVQVSTTPRGSRGRAVAPSAELTAPHVVVTVPLGVLKAGALEFTPRLPGKEALLSRLEMGAAMRVSLQFKGDEWAGRGAFAEEGFLFTGEAPLPVWWMSHPPPWPVITGWAGGRRALALAKLDEAARVSAALDALGAALGVDASRLRRELHAGFSYDWQSDLLARGAYSYAGVGGRQAGIELAAPVEGTLFFAGEATQSDGRNATVHGAIASGERAARQVLGKE
jgi:monoamine oxidase